MTKVALGEQYYEENSNIKTICVAIGILDSENNIINPEDIVAVIVHEFGHVLGLGHSPNCNDIMYNYHCVPVKFQRMINSF